MFACMWEPFCIQCVHSTAVRFFFPIEKVVEEEEKKNSPQYAMDTRKSKLEHVKVCSPHAKYKWPRLIFDDICELTYFIGSFLWEYRKLWCPMNSPDGIMNRTKVDPSKYKMKSKPTIPNRYDTRRYSGNKFESQIQNKIKRIVNQKKSIALINSLGLHVCPMPDWRLYKMCAVWLQLLWKRLHRIVSCGISAFY